MHESVVAIFVHEEDIFSIRRQNYLKAFPGYYAFPGGKIDEEDYQFEFDHPITNEFDSHEIGALFREIEEELGYSLTQDITDRNVNTISKLGIAVTPPLGGIRFNTHYYKVELAEKPKLLVDDGEIAWSGWLHHNDLSEVYDSGKGLMVVPTVRTVQALSKDISLRNVTCLNLDYDLETELPYLELQHQLGFIPVPSNTIPPATTTNSLLLGEEGSPRIITDPSPASDEVLQKLIKTLKPHKLDAILITHHHPDHHERAPQLAKVLGIPILCTEITENRLKKKCGDNYLEGVEIRRISQGEKITRWLGRDVICHELPGHDDGMVGLAADDMSWFYVSDLVEPFTTVVIPEDEGDMAVYFDSLERVIALKPRVIIPSHGMPMGGTHLLKKTLQHRKEREQQIKDLMEEGLNDTEIVEKLYKFHARFLSASSHNPALSASFLF